MGTRQPARGATIDFNFSERGGKIIRVAPEGGCHGVYSPRGQEGTLLNSFAFISLFCAVPVWVAVVAATMTIVGVPSERGRENTGMSELASTGEEACFE